MKNSWLFIGLFSVPCCIRLNLWMTKSTWSVVNQARFAIVGAFLFTNNKIMFFRRSPSTVPCLGTYISVTFHPSWQITTHDRESSQVQNGCCKIWINLICFIVFIMWMNFFGVARTIWGREKRRQENKAHDQR